MLYKKPAHYSHANTSMEVLAEIPEHIVENTSTYGQQMLAEEVVSALNCCRKYSKKGMLVMHVDADLDQCVAIKIQGEVRTFKALQSLNQWMQADDAFALLSKLSGMPISCKAIETYRNMEVF